MFGFSILPSHLEHLSHMVNVIDGESFGSSCMQLEQVVESTWKNVVPNETCWTWGTYQGISSNLNNEPIHWQIPPKKLCILLLFFRESNKKTPTVEFHYRVEEETFQLTSLSWVTYLLDQHLSDILFTTLLLQSYFGKFENVFLSVFLLFGLSFKRYSQILFTKSNARDINFFLKFFTNCWCDEWLLINEKVMLMIDLNEKTGHINNLWLYFH